MSTVYSIVLLVMKGVALLTAITLAYAQLNGIILLPLPWAIFALSAVHLIDWELRRRGVPKKK